MPAVENNLVEINRFVLLPCSLLPCVFYKSFIFHTSISESQEKNIKVKEVDRLTASLGEEGEGELSAEDIKKDALENPIGDVAVM